MPVLCHECGSENPDDSKFCATCGRAAIRSSEPQRSSARTTAVRLIRRRFVLSLTALISLVVILGIGAFYVIEQRRTGPANVSKEVVAATGDSISLGDDITVRIPPGALAADTNVSIARSTSGRSAPSGIDGGELVGSAFNIDLGGEALMKPVKLEIRFDPGRLPEDASTDTVFLSFYDEKSRAWIPVGGKVDRERGVVTIETTHLSWWAPWTWNWEAWIAVLKLGLSLELSEWIDGFELLTTECNKSGQNAGVDEAKANNVIQGCISNDDPASPEFRVVNIKSFHIGISPAPDGPGYPSPTVLGPGDDITFTGHTSDQPPAVVYAEFTESAMWRFVAELVARMLPAADQIPEEGLAFIADGLQRTFTAQEISEALDAGDELGAAEGLYQLITGESFIETFLTLAAEYGQQHGIDMMTKWTQSGVRQVLLGVASVDVIISTTDFLANYLFNNHSQVAFNWEWQLAPAPELPPVRVVSVEPLQEQTGISVAPQVVVEFSSSVAGRKVELKTEPAAEFSTKMEYFYAGGENKVTFDAGANLKPGTTYNVRVLVDEQSLFAWNFTTKSRGSSQNDLAGVATRMRQELPIGDGFRISYAAAGDRFFVFIEKAPIEAYQNKANAWLRNMGLRDFAALNISYVPKGSLTP